MAPTVVDASVVAKWYIPERHHEQARALRDDYLNGTHDLYAPALIPFEILNALKYSRHFDSDELRDAATSVSEYGLELVPSYELGPVVSIATESDVTTYDTFYVALAESHDTTAYTADTNLLDALENTAYSDVVTHIKSCRSCGISPSPFSTMNA